MDEAGRALRKQAVGPPAFYGAANVEKTSLRLAVLPELACTNSGRNVAPTVAKPS